MISDALRQSLHQLVATTKDARERLLAELVKTPEGKARLQAAVNEYWPYLPKFFGGSKSRNNEVFRKWKIKQRTNDEMREDYVRRATEVAAKYGLTLPVAAAAA